MSTNTILLLAVAGAALYMVSQRASPANSAAAAPTPVSQPGFGFNLGFFKND